MVQIYADDVHRLLAHLTRDRSCVFASSGGATIALEVVARHPEQLEMVVSHEPPTPSLVPHSAEVRAAMQDVCDTCEKEGMWPAMQKFAVVAGLGGPPPAPQGEPTPEEREAQALMMGNMDFFFSRYIRAIARYEPDIEALKACSCKIVAGVGADTEGQLAHNGGLGLAHALGSEAVIFPGDHGGFDGKPVEFAAKLREVLASK